MPNHVINKITISGYTSSQIKDRFSSEGREFDFNKLIPTPMHIYQGLISKEDEEDFPNWYKWNIDNWGTKWNCYDSSVEDAEDEQSVVIKFNTAWSVPYPIIVALANHLKSESMIHEYFDEGHLRNCSGTRFQRPPLMTSCERRMSGSVLRTGSLRTIRMLFFIP